YLGRITKAHILDAVREAASEDAAERLSDLKKQPMAEAAEQLLAGTGWLPALLRTEQPAMSVERQDEAADARSADFAELEPKPSQPDTAEEAEAFNVAAE
ncbi:chromosome partitioning protein ParB, partial [Mesorhizobium sp. M7A.F.Ca.AU.002.02.1.1]